MSETETPVAADNMTHIKQAYLKKNILDKGYNSDVFIDYISSKKTDGNLIENWSLEELIQHVHNFIRLPHIFFPDSHVYNVHSTLSKLIITPADTNRFSMVHANTEKEIFRKISDIELVEKLASKELPSMSIMNRSLANNVDIRFALEHLFSYYICFNSPILNAFFEVSENDFDIYKNVG